nr:hypothetical protein [Oxalobacteraceae bacterium]
MRVGDLVLQDDNQISVVRNGVIVATRTFGPETLANTAATSAETVSKVVFFRSNPVAGQSVVMTSVAQNQTTGVVTIRYSNGSERTFTNWAEINQSLGEMDQQSDLAEKILALKAYRNSPDGTDKTTMLDVNCTINFDAGTPIALIEPQ